jgi:hypothetical protein
MSVKSVYTDSTVMGVWVNSACRKRPKSAAQEQNNNNNFITRGMITVRALIGGRHARLSADCFCSVLTELAEAGNYG